MKAAGHIGAGWNRQTEINGNEIEATFRIPPEELGELGGALGTSAMELPWLDLGSAQGKRLDSTQSRRIGTGSAISHFLTGEVSTVRLPFTMAETDHAATVVPLRRLRHWLWFWRISVVLSLAVLGYFWIQSQSRIHHRLIPVGIGGLELCVAASSAAVSIMGEEFPSVHFGDALSPPDSESLLHYEARWRNGEPFGRVSNICLFPPTVESLERVDLDRMGSLSFMFTKIPSPAGGAHYFHLRLPFWFLMVLVIGGWIWLERFSARRRRKASVAD